MAAVAHMSHEVCPDALPYIDQDYEEPGVRDMVRLSSMNFILIKGITCHCVIYAQ